MTPAIEAVLRMTPPPAFGEVRPERLRDPKGAAQVDVDFPLPVSLRELGHAAQDGDAGIVHQHLDPAVCRQRLLHKPRHVLLTGDVGAHGERGATVRYDRRGDRGRAGRVAVGADDRAPSSAKRSAVSRPMPDAAPVTTAFLPASLTGAGR